MIASIPFHYTREEIVTTRERVIEERLQQHKALLRRHDVILMRWEENWLLGLLERNYYKAQVQSIYAGFYYDILFSRKHKLYG